jgi:hypothetical protein
VRGLLEASVVVRAVCPFFAIVHLRYTLSDPAPRAIHSFPSATELCGLCRNIRRIHPLDQTAVVRRPGSSETLAFAHHLLQATRTAGPRPYAEAGRAGHFLDGYRSSRQDNPFKLWHCLATGRLLIRNVKGTTRDVTGQRETSNVWATEWNSSEKNICFTARTHASCQRLLLAGTV